MKKLTAARLAALCLSFVIAASAGAVVVDPFAAAALSEPADLTHDGVVDNRDLVVLLGDYGRRITGGSDINLDGVVDTNDMSAVLGAWSSLPTICARHIGGDDHARKIYIDSVIDIERSPLRSDWTRIWTLDLSTGEVLGFDVDVYFEATLAVLVHRRWAGPRDWR